LWLSTVSSSCPPASNGYDSPISFSAPEALRVEDGRVLAGAVEILENRGAGALDRGGHRRGARARRVRVAEHVLTEQGRVLTHL